MKKLRHGLDNVPRISKLESAKARIQHKFVWYWSLSSLYPALLIPRLENRLFQHTRPPFPPAGWVQAPWWSMEYCIATKHTHTCTHAHTHTCTHTWPHTLTLTYGEPGKAERWPSPLTPPSMAHIYGPNYSLHEGAGMGTGTVRWGLRPL